LRTVSVALPGVFESTIFSRQVPVTSSPYIRAMHPKTEIRPEATAIKKALGAGWVGQTKIHGHRAQIHLPADVAAPVTVFNRQGRPHAKALPAALVAELRRLIPARDGFTVLDAEWTKDDDHLYLFDVLRWEGKSLAALTYPERYELLPRVYSSESVTTLPLFTTVEQCLKVLGDPDPKVEGLVFKARRAKGFGDANVVRCRKSPRH
jgi:ATP-dependent DNA ligase